MNLIPDRISAVGIAAAIFLGVLLPVPALVFSGVLAAGGLLVEQPKRSTVWYIATAAAASALARLFVHTILGTFLM